MAYTISFHHGSERVVPHNRRDRQNEAHIDPNGIHQTWVDENISDAYDRLFGAALGEYNAKQKRKDRRIRSYLQNVRSNPKLHDAYEFIAQIGNEKSHPDELTCQKILREYVENFIHRNTNLVVIGAYYHADEVGGCPHIHVDYIPVAQGKKTGLKIRNNLSSALAELGYTTEYVEDTKRGINSSTQKPYTKMVSGEMKFQNAEREVLMELCRQHSVSIENPGRDKSSYCSSKQLREARDVRMQNEKRSRELQNTSNSLTETRTALDSYIDDVNYQIRQFNAEKADFDAKLDLTACLGNDFCQHYNLNERTPQKTLLKFLKDIVGKFKEWDNRLKKVLDAPLEAVENWCKFARQQGFKTLREFLFPSKKITRTIQKKELPTQGRE